MRNMQVCMLVDEVADRSATLNPESTKTINCME